MSEKFNAAKMRKLTQEVHPNVDEEISLVKELIEVAASKGLFYVRTSKSLCKDTIKHFEKSGFQVFSEIDGPYDTEYWVFDWRNEPKTLQTIVPTVKKIIALISVLIIGYYALLYNSIKEIEITVVHTEHIVKNESSKYMIYTENEVFEVFENIDSFSSLDFKSSDLYAALRPGETYNVKVVGWRIPFRSKYRNIIKII